MAWRIGWTERAARDLRAIAPPIARGIIARIEAGAADVRDFERIPAADDVRLAAADHRVFALLSHDTRTVLVERVVPVDAVYQRP